MGKLRAALVGMGATYVCLAMGAEAQTVNPFEQSEDQMLALEEDLLSQGDGSSVRLYGFIEGYFEKVSQTPAGVADDGSTVFEQNPHEFDVANLNVMVQGTIGREFRYFVNLAAPGSGSPSSDEAIVLRNAWVEMPIVADALVLRLGKTYRRFGIYNEILDASPTFIGIEAPELFDGDHLLLTRTTNLMLHGRWLSGDHTLGYALMTGNDERVDDAIPLGADVYYDWADSVRLGSSFYTTGGPAGPSRAVGEGSPRGGVINWMAEDDYLVFGGYLSVHLDSLIFEGAYWHALHRATRDPDAVFGLLGADLNARQLSRFGLDGADPSPGDVPVDADYTVQTFYARLGYAVESDVGEWTPYAQFDFYRNPETIQAKSFGGDAEAGLSDDGQFVKITAGIVYRPLAEIALKVDGSTHVQTFNGESIQYPEIRAALSYFWQMEVL